MTDLERIPLGIYEKGIPLALSWRDKFVIAKKAGFDYIELSIDGKDPRIKRLDWTDEMIAELRKLANHFEMPFRTMALSANRFYPLGDPKRFDAGIEIVKKAIILAAKLKIPIIQLAPYDVYQKESTADTRIRFASSLFEILELIQAYPVTLAMEVLEDVPHFSTITQCAAFVRKVNHPQFKLYADTGNVAYNGFDVVSDLAGGQGEIVACHLKDAISKDEHNIPYGTGLVDFNSVLRHFKNTDFQGTFTAEVWCEEELGFIRQLPSIQRFLRNKIKEENKE